MVDRLEAMAMLVCSADEGSLSAAARKLEIPIATLTRNVNNLEAFVGTKLLIKTTRKLVLTEAGAEYVATARRILEDVDELEKRAAGEFSTPRGELVITSPVQVNRLRVLPVINQFLKLYPEIRIRLLQSDRIVDLVDFHADVAIRIGHLRDSSLVAKRVGLLRVVTVASPDFLEMYGRPTTPNELINFPCIIFDSPSLSPWRYCYRDTGQVSMISNTPRLIVSSPDAAVDAALNGLGTTLVLEHDVHDLVKAGKLSYILENFEVDPIPVHVVFLSRSAMSAKLRQFIDFAVPQLSQLLSAFGKRL